jgi:FAD/FMN-containing dehydrogenase
VAVAVSWAAERGLRVAAPGTGHNAGPLEPLGETVLLWTDCMRGIQIDPAARTGGSGH